MISRGIIEKHQVTIPLRKIQAIKIKENIIRQLFGFVTVSIVSAGGGDREKEEGALTILFPMIHKKSFRTCSEHLRRNIRWKKTAAACRGAR